MTTATAPPSWELPAARVRAMKDAQLWDTLLRRVLPRCVNDANFCATTSSDEGQNPTRRDVADESRRTSEDDNGFEAPKVRDRRVLDHSRALIDNSVDGDKDRTSTDLVEQTAARFLDWSLTPPLLSVLRLIERSHLLELKSTSPDFNADPGCKYLYPDVHDTIHTQTYSFECKLLTEVVDVRLASGDIVRCRPCCFGSRCQGTSPLIHNAAKYGGVVLREYLTPREYGEFHTNGITPAERRPCLLCLRSQIHYAHMCLVQSLQQYESPNILLNNFVNPRDAPDGYISTSMIPREYTPRFQGLAGFVCTSEKHMLAWNRNAEARNVFDFTTDDRRKSIDHEPRNSTVVNRSLMNELFFPRLRTRREVLENCEHVLRAYHANRIPSSSFLSSPSSNHLRGDAALEDDAPPETRYYQIIKSDLEILNSIKENTSSNTGATDRDDADADDDDADRIICEDTLQDIYAYVEKALHNGAIDATSTPQYRPAKTKKRAKGSGAVEEVVEAQDRETQMRIDMDKLGHIIAKCIPRACHMRALTVVLGRFMSRHAQSRRMFAELLICSLLGNYRDSVVRAPRAFRRWLYSKRRQIELALPSYVNTLVTDDMFILFAIREHADVVIRRSPGMNAFANTHFVWEKLGEVIRGTFRRCFALTCSVLQFRSRFGFGFAEDATDTQSDSENDDADTSTSPRFPPRLLRILRPLSKKLRMANRNVSRIVNVEGYNGGDDDTGAPSVFGFGAGSIPRLSRPMSVELQTCLRDVNYDSLAARGFVVGERALSTEERRRLIDDTCAYFRYDIRRTHRSRRRSKSMVLRGDDDDAGEEEGDKRSIDNDEGRSTSLRDVSRRFLHRAIEMQTQPLQAIGFLQLLLHENAASMIALPRQISRAQSAAVRRRRFIDSRCSSAASPIHDANPSVLYYCPSCHTIKNLFEEEEYGYLDMAIRSCEIGSESSAVCTATSSKGAGCGHVPVLRYETVNTTSETSCICVIRGIGYVTTTCCARVLPMHRVVFDDARSHALICAACLARTVENGRVGGVLSAVSKQEEGKREKTETRARSL
eukprot:gene16930-20117_t